MQNDSDKDQQLQNLERRIKVQFHDQSLLKTALIHRSYLNEVRDQKLENNERLEFLGDAVLELLVTGFLFENYPDRSEGDLTSFRAATVKTESLAQTAELIGLGEYLYMSKGEERTGGRNRPYILANTFEALLGALYLDQGIEAAKTFLEQNLFGKIEAIVKNRLDIDSKSKLQELAQERFGFTPVYQMVNAEGPDHLKTFEMAVKIGEHSFATGSGKSKQEAEQAAAANALKDWERLAKQYYS
jgi:ribonuclease-3